MIIRLIVLNPFPSAISFSSVVQFNEWFFHHSLCLFLSTAVKFVVGVSYRSFLSGLSSSKGACKLHDFGISFSYLGRVFLRSYSFLIWRFLFSALISMRFHKQCSKYGYIFIQIIECLLSNQGAITHTTRKALLRFRYRIIHW